MKILFSAPGKAARIADKDRMIFDLGTGEYYDISGSRVPAEKYFQRRFDSCRSDDPWKSLSQEYEGTDQKLMARSTVEVDYDIDDIFGNFGFVNEAGEFVIEPQYAFAHDFSCGLAAVNLNRTWYKSANGNRYYENHFGYINERGETVIPFAYDEAYPFNKYGAAVAKDRERSYLIDTAGKTLPYTEGLSFDHFYEYDDRFMEFSNRDADYCDERPIGLYDTKERIILIEPSEEHFIETVIQWSEDLILVYEKVNKPEPCDFISYYINSKGEKLFPWLLNKGFSRVERPNASQVTIVAISEFIELTGDPDIYYPANGRKYELRRLYGLYSSKERFILPPEYDNIRELAENIFACVKNDTVTVILAEDEDF